MPEYLDDDQRWAASRARDGAARHAFYICVRTTGIYCISTCAGRPLRKNVFFVETRAEARAAGMRACKRCKPDAPLDPATEGPLFSRDPRGSARGARRND